MYCQISEISAEEIYHLREEIQRLLFEKAELRVKANKVDRYIRQNQLLSADNQNLRSQLSWALMTINYIIAILEERGYKNNPFIQIIERGRFILKQLQFFESEPEITVEIQNQKLRDRSSR